MSVQLIWIISVVAGLASMMEIAAAQGTAFPMTNEINITSDSAPGWRPSESQQRTVVKAAGDFFSSLDRGEYEQAYAMMAEPNRHLQPLQQFISQNQTFHARSGALKRHTILKVTWTKDPPRGPFPGVFAAIDIASQYTNVDRHCGYVVLYQRSANDRFEIMRQEDNFIDNATAQAIEQQKSRAELDKLWARLAANCPNYSSSSATSQ
jgi:Protein of unknown function (DUF4019)